MKAKPPRSTKGEEALIVELRARADESLGAYIRRIRLMRGMGLAEVADATPTVPESRHVSYSYLSQIELGRALSPSRERLVSIALVLGVPPAWLLEKAGFAGGTEPRAEDRGSPSPIVKEIALRAGQLDQTDQEAFLQMIDAVLRMRRRRRHGGRKGAKS